MGKATIITSLGEGQYTVALDHGQSIYLPVAERLDDEIADANSQAASIDLTLSAAEALLSSYLVDLDAAIAFLQGNPEDESLKAQVETNTRYVVNQRKVVDDLRFELSTVRLRRVSLQKRRDVITGIYGETPEQADLWCADYNTDLTGDVETIEIGIVSGSRPGKVDNPISVISPAGEDGTGAAWVEGTGTRLVPKELVTPNQAFLNYALTPGSAKWKPRYRKGEITSKTGDSCVVLLDETRSTHQSLDVNQQTSVTADIIYMGCNGGAFEVGDRVMVAFTGRDWAAPKVIGFEANPVACAPSVVLIMLIDISGLGTYLRSVRNSNTLAQKSSAASEFPSESWYYGGQVYYINHDHPEDTGVWIWDQGTPIIKLNEWEPQTFIGIQNRMTGGGVISIRGGKIICGYRYGESHVGKRNKVRAGIATFDLATRAQLSNTVLFDWEYAEYPDAPPSFAGIPAGWSPSNGAGTTTGLILVRTTRNAELEIINDVHIYSEDGSLLADLGSTNLIDSNLYDVKFAANSTQYAVWKPYNGNALTIYDAEGVVVLTTTVAMEAAPEDPPNYSGRVLVMYSISMDDTHLYIGRTTSYERGNFSPPRLYHLTYVQLRQYRLDSAPAFSFPKDAARVDVDLYARLTLMREWVEE